MKKGSKKAREAGRKAALTRKRNMGKGGTPKSKSKRGHGEGRCPQCGFKLPKSLLKRKKRHISAAQKRRFNAARNAALKAGWKPFTRMNKEQKAAFRKGGGYSD
jgi:hypothetical protein